MKGMEKKKSEGLEYYTRTTTYDIRGLNWGFKG
jgi:hypothetical protein